MKALKFIASFFLIILSYLAVLALFSLFLSKNFDVEFDKSFVLVAWVSTFMPYLEKLNDKHVVRRLKDWYKR